MNETSSAPSDKSLLGSISDLVKRNIVGLILFALLVVSSGFWFASKAAKVEQFYYLVLTLLCIVLGALVFFKNPRSIGEEKESVENPGSIFAEAFANKGILILLLAVTVLGSYLRFYGISFGLPDPFHPDEYKKSHIILKMIKHQSLNPHYFKHPTLLLYLTRAMTKLLYYVHYYGLMDLPYSGPPRVLLAGRVVSAISGTLAIPITFMLGLVAFSPWVGLFGAALLAVSPLHIVCSHYLKEDSLFTTMLLLTVLAVTIATKRGGRKALLTAGFFAGLTFGSKYTGILAFGPVFGLPWLRAWNLILTDTNRKEWPSSKALLTPHLPFLKLLPLALLLGGIAFSITTPFMFVEWDTFQDNFMLELRHAESGHAGVAITAVSNLWMYHLKGSIAPGMGFVVALAALCGIGLVVARLRPEGLLIAGTALVFYLSAEYAKSKPLPQPDRYVVQCLPFLTLLAAEFIFNSFQKWRLTVAALLIFILPLSSSVAYARELVPDTRLKMRSWMRQNLKEDERILVAGGAVYLPNLKRTKFKVGSTGKVGIKRNRPLIPQLKASGYNYLLYSSFDSDRFFRPVSHPEKTKEKVSREEMLEKEFSIVHREIAGRGSYGFHNPRLILFRLK